MLFTGRLEELLIKYPDEPMSSKRWAKIAKELGKLTFVLQLEFELRFRKVYKSYLKILAYLQDY